MQVLKKLKWNRVAILLIVLSFLIYIVIISILFLVNICPLEQPNTPVKENTKGSAIIVLGMPKNNKIESLDYTSELIKVIADEYNLDWKLAIAIARHETGHYTSRAFKELNNVGGNYKNGLMKFDTLETGIEFFIRNLKYNYIDKGLLTIEEIQKKYAPLNVANDPNNLNRHWVSVVNKIYDSLER